MDIIALQTLQSRSASGVVLQFGEFPEILPTTSSNCPSSSPSPADVLTSSGVTGQGLSFGLHFFGFRVLQVAGLFHHASIGNPINIAIVRLILLEDEEVKRNHRGWLGCTGCCPWQPVSPLLRCLHGLDELA